MGYYLDGRVTAVVGTHTHVPTADEKILPNGTAYITDVGYAGGINSIIGMSPESILPKFLTGLPSKTAVSQNQAMVNSVIIKLDELSYKATEIKRICQ